MAGRPPKEKSFANMLNIALTAKGVSGETKLREVAEVLVSKALEGEPWAVNMVADRVDGKPLQAIEHSGEIGDGTSKEQRDAAFAAAVQAEADERKARMN
jgi:hypothetical protein